MYPPNGTPTDIEPIAEDLRRIFDGFIEAAQYGDLEDARPWICALQQRSTDAMIWLLQVAAPIELIDNLAHRTARRLEEEPEQ